MDVESDLEADEPTEPDDPAPQQAQRPRNRGIGGAGADGCAGKGKGAPLTFGTLNTQGCPDVFYQALLARGPEEGDTRQRAVATFVKCDMLGVTEMKGHHPDKVAAAGERVVGCKPPPVDDARAAGVSIFHSPRAAKLKVNKGVVEGGRIAWVRLRGAFHDIRGVVVYVPPRSRAKPPFWNDVFDKLECLVRKIRRKRDCVVRMGDS